MIFLKHFIKFSIPEKIYPREIKIRDYDLTIIMGPRRAGKTYYFFQLMKNKKDVLYINFEYDYFINLTLQDLDKMFEDYYAIYGKNPKYLFFDEIQNVENWENFIRRLYETKKYKIFITGSNSKLLSKEIATTLRGISVNYVLYPLSFREFLTFKDLKYDKFCFYTSKKGKIISYLTEYLKIGGYPEVVKNPDIMEKLLKSILEGVFYRDIIERYKIREIKILKYLLYYLCKNISSPISASKLENILKSSGIKHISKKTILDYMDIFQDVFLFFFLDRYKINYKESLKDYKKVYCVDHGLANYVAQFDKFDKIIENIVFVDLLRRKDYFGLIDQIYYYKTKNGNEIDFLIKSKNKIDLIEVTYELDEDHIKKMIKGMNELNLTKGTIITMEEEKIIKKENKEIKVIPLWKWLLDL